MDREAVDRLLLRFKKNGLIRESRFVREDFIAVMYTTCFFRKCKITTRIAQKLNAALLLCFLPVFILGSFIYIKYGEPDWEWATVGIWAGLAVGLVLHEAGHAIAGLAYRARVFEAGIMLRFLFPGAYVMLDDRPVRNKLHRIQIYAAGVEMNLLIAGSAFLLASVTGEISGLFLGIAIQNIVLTALNLAFIWGLDGEKILSTLLGRKNIVDMATTIVFHKYKRKSLWKKGLDGKAATVASFFVCLMQIALPVLLLSNIIEVILWFVDLF